MPQFFSSQPVDYGARYTAEGWQGLANGIASGINEVSSRRASDESYAKRAQIDANLRKQMQESEVTRQVLMTAHELGVDPVIDPVTKETDVFATAALNKKAKDIQDIIRQRAGFDYELNARNQAELNRKADTWGVSRNQQGLPSPDAVKQAWSTGTDVAALPRQNPNVNLAQVVQAKEDEHRLKMAADEAKIRNEASAPYREKYTDRGPYQVGGKYIGNAVRDTVTGQIGFMQDGKMVPLPDGAEPITATGLQKSIPDLKEFRKLKGDLTSSEISLRGMDRYMQSVGDANTGLQRLADIYAANMRTLIGKKELNPQEIAAKMAQGQLQGLLGSNRTNVVGGGVMTEQDALRIIDRLGGDANALQNPELVKQAIGQVYSDRYKQYQDDLRFYNAAVNDYYGSQGFEKAKDTPFSANFDNDYAAPKNGQPSGVPPVPGVPSIDDRLKKYLK